MVSKTMRHGVIVAAFGLAFQGCDPEEKEDKKVRTNLRRVELDQVVDNSLENIEHNGKALIDEGQIAMNEGISELVKVSESAIQEVAKMGADLWKDGEKLNPSELVQNFLGGKEVDSITKDLSGATQMLVAVVEESVRQIKIPTKAEINSTVAGTYSEIEEVAKNLIGVDLPKYEGVIVEELDALAQKEVGLDLEKMSLANNIHEAEYDTAIVADDKTDDSQSTTDQKKLRNRKLMKYGAATLGAVIAGVAGAAAYGHYVHNDPKHLFNRGASGVKEGLHQASTSLQHVTAQVGDAAKQGIAQAQDYSSAAYHQGSDYISQKVNGLSTDQDSTVTQDSAVPQDSAEEIGGSKKTWFGGSSA